MNDRQAALERAATLLFEGRDLWTMDVPGEESEAWEAAMNQWADSADKLREDIAAVERAAPEMRPLPEGDVIEIDENGVVHGSPTPLADARAAILAADAIISESDLGASRKNAYKKWRALPAVVEARQEKIT